MKSATETSAPTRKPRVAPSWKVALLVIIGYSIVTPGLMAISGLDYDELFYSSANVWKGVLIPLMAGAVYLLAVVSFLRWDHVFGDPGRLPMNKLLWAPVVLMTVGAIIRFTGVPGDIPFDLIALIIAAGVLVGFTEETVFRGILLRAMRAGRLPEIKVAIIVSVAFGLFHLTNLGVGSPLPVVLFQVTIASISGFALYLARRGTGLLVAGMVLHGFWDISSFLVSTEDGFTSLGANVAQGLLILNVIVILAAVVWAYKNQPVLRLTESGTTEGG